MANTQEPSRREALISGHHTDPRIDEFMEKANSAIEFNNVGAETQLIVSRIIIIEKPP